MHLLMKINSLLRANTIARCGAIKVGTTCVRFRVTRAWYIVIRRLIDVYAF